MRHGFAYVTPYRLTPVLPLDWPSYLPASPHRLTTTRSRSRASPTGHPKVSHQRLRMVSITDSPWARIHGYGNINPLSIDYACRPRLRSRLTLGGLTWPRNPWSFGGQSFSLCLSLLMPAFSLPQPPQLDHSAASTAAGRSPTHPHHCHHSVERCGVLCECRGFGGVLEPRYIVGAGSLDQ